MTRTSISVCWLALASLAVLALVHQSANAAPTFGTVRAGRDARLACTLDDVPLAGYGGGDRRKSWPSDDGHTFFFRPNEGVADPVRIKTVALEVDGERMAFVSFDAVGVPINLIEAVVAELSDTGLTRQNIVFSGTHTHSGPGAISDRVFWQIVAVDLYDPEVFAHVKDNMVASIRAAVADLQPARLGTGAGAVEGITANRRHEGAPVNTELAIIRVEDDDGAPLAAIFNFAIHGTSLSASNLLLSADNMGYAERYVESALPGAIGVFLNGAEADVKPVEGGFDGAQQVGEALGEAVAELWHATATDNTATLEIQTREVSLPPLQVNVTTCDDTVSALLEAWLIGLPGETAETAELFMAIRLDDAAWVTVPGEPITAIGAQIAAPVRDLGFANAFILGLANGYMGYVVTPEEYDLGGYETCGTLHGRDTGVFVVDQAVAVATMLTPPDSSPPAPDAGPLGASDAGPSGVDATPSADAAVALGEDAGGAGADAAAEETGCGCSASRRPSSSELVIFVLAVAGLVPATRRRRATVSRSGKY